MAKNNESGEDPVKKLALMGGRMHLCIGGQHVPLSAEGITKWRDASLRDDRGEADGFFGGDRSA